MKVAFLWILLIGGLVAVVLYFIAGAAGTSPPPPPVAPSDEMAEVAQHLRDSVQGFAHGIGERSMGRTAALSEASDIIELALHRSGLSPVEQKFQSSGIALHNVVGEIPGARTKEIVILCAHYDTPSRTPGADDASGTAALLELSNRLSKRVYDRTLRFVFFAASQGLVAGTDGMGSRFAAKASKDAGERIVAVLSLDTLGVYSDEPRSQTRPFPLGICYPDQGNFLAFAADLGSRSLLKTSVVEFRAAGLMPAEGVCLPSWTPGLSIGDQASYWGEGFKALLVTDTGSLRNQNYHTMTDTYDRLDYARLARAVVSLTHVAESLASRTALSN